MQRLKRLIKLLGIIIFINISCIKNSENQRIDQELAEDAKNKNEFAELFSINRNGEGLVIESAGEKLEIKEVINKIIITETSSFAYIKELKEVEKIIGVSESQNFYDSFIKEQIKSGKITEIGNAQNLDFEKIINLKPDLIITTHRPSYSYVLEKLKNYGIKVLYIEEYNEKHPLAKTEYLKLMGIILQKEELANAIFNQIKNKYFSLKKEAQAYKIHPKVFVNVMYGDIWYLPGGNSLMATLIKDSGADYLWKNENKKRLLLNFEEVYLKAKDADFWISIPFDDKRRLIENNRNYEKFKAFRNHKIYSMNKRMKNESNGNNGNNDYYESGVIYCDLVLSDLIHIFHTENLSEDQLIYAKQLK